MTEIGKFLVRSDLVLNQINPFLSYNIKRKMGIPKTVCVLFLLLFVFYVQAVGN